MTRACPRLCVFAAACVVIAACAPARELSRGTLDVAALAALDAWESRGRVALNTEGRGVQANFLWRQDGPKARVQLSGPWGVGAEEVLIEGPEAMLRSDGAWVPMCASPTAPDEMSLLCAAAPLNSLPFWLRGLPDPGRPYQENRSPENGVREFSQAGWRVEVNALARTGPLTVPRRVFISGPGATLRVAITNWALTAAP